MNPRLVGFGPGTVPLAGSRRGERAPALASNRHGLEHLAPRSWALPRDAQSFRRTPGKSLAQARSPVPFGMGSVTSHRIGRYGETATSARRRTLDEPPGHRVQPDHRWHARDEHARSSPRACWRPSPALPHDHRDQRQRRRTATDAPTGIRRGGLQDRLSLLASALTVRRSTATSQGRLTAQERVHRRVTHPAGGAVGGGRRRCSLRGRGTQ
jgi:hypothetical protein